MLQVRQFYYLTAKVLIQTCNGVKHLQVPCWNIGQITSCHSWRDRTVACDATWSHSAAKFPFRRILLSDSALWVQTESRMLVQTACRPADKLPGDLYVTWHRAKHFITRGFKLFFISGLAPVFKYWLLLLHRHCGLVVRVHGCRSGGPGSIPGTTRFSEKKRKENK
jgi:hypothetical protein